MGVATELLDRLFDVIEDEEPGIVYTMDFAEDAFTFVMRMLMSSVTSPIS